MGASLGRPAQASNEILQATVLLGNETLEVVGGGALTIVDPSELEFSSMARVRKNDPICLIGLRLHILDQGSTFNLHTRVAAAAPAIANRV